MYVVVSIIFIVFITYCSYLLHTCTLQFTIPFLFSRWKLLFPGSACCLLSVLQSVFRRLFSTPMLLLSLSMTSSSTRDTRAIVPTAFADIVLLALVILLFARHWSLVNLVTTFLFFVEFISLPSSHLWDVPVPPICSADIAFNVFCPHRLCPIKSSIFSFAVRENSVARTGVCFFRDTFLLSGFIQATILSMHWSSSWGSLPPVPRCSYEQGPNCSSVQSNTPSYKTFERVDPRTDVRDPPLLILTVIGLLSAYRTIPL